MSKVVCEVSRWRFLLLDDAPPSGRPVEVNSDQFENIN